MKQLRLLEAPADPKHYLPGAMKMQPKAQIFQNATREMPKTVLVDTGPCCNQDQAQSTFRAQIVKANVKT